MIPNDWTIPYEERSWIHRLDPRGRIVTTLLIAVAVVLVNDMFTVLIMLATALFMTLSARYTACQLIYRLSGLALFCAVLIAFLPLSATLTPTFTLVYAPELLDEALLISAKSCTVMLFLIALISTIEPTALGHALVHLHVPRSLVQLYLFTIRYFDVLRREMQVMHTAMLARGFKPSFSPHTLKSYGHLIGMLLIRSLDRSERILTAMKCRGYQGKFFLYHHFHFRRRDAWFVTVSAIASLAVISWKHVS